MSKVGIMLGTWGGGGHGAKVATCHGGSNWKLMSTCTSIHAYGSRNQTKPSSPLPSPPTQSFVVNT